MLLLLSSKEQRYIKSWLHPKQFRIALQKISFAMRVLLAAAFALASANAATHVAVIELGKSGTVRRTTTNDVNASPDAVTSFWSSLHGYGRKLQHAGMPMVPDLFSRPESGVVVGLTGVDLDSMPELNTLMTEEGSNGVVGHMNVHGQHCSTMLRSVNNVASVEPATLSSTFQSQASEAGLSGLKMQVTSENASDIDSKLAADLELLRADAARSGRTVVVHIIVEEDDGAARRRRLARRLAEDEGQNNNNKNNDNNKNQNNNNADGDADQAEEAANGYYGYGYYNAYGEWVTPYKTMFQIQYFNVVLWTSIGLIVALLFSLYLMLYMPMMADTLLFGQSAMAVGAD